jgi:hypothetical protein
VELTKKFDISPTLDVVDLYEFHEGEKRADEGTLSEWEQHLQIKSEENIEDILATRIGKKTHQKEYMEYLIKWKNRGVEDALWVPEDQLSCVHNSSPRQWYEHELELMFFLLGMSDVGASLGSGNPHHPKIFLFHKLDNKSNKDCVSGPFYLVSFL